MILRRLFEKKVSGFYIDVGAHHPFRFSNTFIFYKQGWRGINIDAMPGSMKIFQKKRPRDINLEIPIGNNNSMLTYYCFNEPALNGFSQKLSMERDGKEGFYIEKKILLQNRTLDSVLDMYLPYETKIDFMSIDVEGLDLDVLRSNDWLKYRPIIILIEILNSELAEIESSEIAVFLKSNGYSIFSKAVHTVFFLDKKANLK
jgi:FkbM family methyltransferase